VLLNGDRVVLRPLGADDIDLLVALFAEPAVAEWWPRFDRTPRKTRLCMA
jgi:hypothetical protein